MEETRITGVTTADAVADTLREAIIQGKLEAGRSLAQQELASRYGISRIPLREALRKLEAEGLVTIRANRGATVTTLSLQEIQEIYELRMLIEGDLITRAVPLLTTDHLQRVEAIHKALGKEKDLVQQDRLNRQFHSLLYAPAGRPSQLALVESLRNQVERYQNSVKALMLNTRAFQRDHLEIYRACTNHNAKKARAKLIGHLNHAMKIVLQHLESQPQ